MEIDLAWRIIRRRPKTPPSWPITVLPFPLQRNGRRSSHNRTHEQSRSSQMARRWSWRQDTVRQIPRRPHRTEQPANPLQNSYPKHVWSPSGGWYAQPANWKMNTAILGAVMLGIGVIVFKISSELEERNRMPEPGRFYPSR